MPHAARGSGGSPLIGGILIMAIGIYIILVTNSQFVNFNGADVPKLWVAGPIIAFGAYLFLVVYTRTERAREY